MVLMVCWQSRCRAGELYELPEVNGYFDDQQHYKAIKALCSYTHPMLPNTMFGSLNALKRKLQDEHKLHFCDLCIKGRKVCSTSKGNQHLRTCSRWSAVCAATASCHSKGSRWTGQH